LAPDQVKANLAKYGANILTPPKTTPEWFRCFKNLFGGFQILLWIGSILCFIAYGIETSQQEFPQKDNVGKLYHIHFPQS
jgi:sodium/potassium-transporting ATPase subunit alpha